MTTTIVQPSGLPPATACGLVTLMSDFGLSEPFVGVMTGAVLRHNPSARVVQLCHGIQPQATAEAAFWLERCYPWFPSGTVHVAVIDPGVGTQRAILVAQIDAHFFVVPDAGLLSARLLATPNAEVVSVDLSRLRLPEPSSTFHGRDLFAPIAARLSSGQHNLVDFGSTVTPRAAQQRAVVSGSGSISGEVVVVDRFGNLLSNIELGADTQVDHVSIGSRLIPFGRTYADAEAGRLIAIVNSFGVVEVAERNGNAEQRIRAERGTPLIVHLKPLPDR